MIGPGYWVNEKKIINKWLNVACLNQDTIKIPAMVWMFVSPQKSYVDTLMLNMMVLRGRAFGRCLGHEGGVLINVINVLLKKTLQRSLTPLTMPGRTREFVQPRRGLEPNQAGTLISDFQELWEIIFLGGFFFLIKKNLYNF